jgi:hypothetical protein
MPASGNQARHSQRTIGLAAARPNCCACIARRSVPRGIVILISSRDASDPPLCSRVPSWTCPGGSLASRSLEISVRGSGVDCAKTPASRAPFLRCARRRQCLGAARRPLTRMCAASGIDRASAQRSLGWLCDAARMADFDVPFRAGVSCGYLVGVVLTPPPHRSMWGAWGSAF